MTDSPPIALPSGQTKGSLLPLGSLIFPAFLLSRLFFAFWMYLGHISHPFQEKMAGGFIGVSNWWLNPWTLYDSEHFLSIARSGYKPLTTAFFPLYPLLMRPFGPDENKMALAGFLISNVAFLVALVMLWKLTNLRFGPKIAKRSVWILAFFPCAAYGSAVYTESLFLALSLSCFWFSTRRQWWLCALFGILASLTRNAGPLIFIALLLDGCQFSSHQGKWRLKSSWGVVLSALAPLLTFIAFQTVLKNQFGALASVEAQQHFNRATTWPWIPVYRDLARVFIDHKLDPVTLSNLTITLGSFALIWKFRRRMPPGELFLLGGALLANMIVARTFPSYLASALRYGFGLFPLTQMFALWSEELTTSRISTVLLWVFGLFWGVIISVFLGLKFFVG